MDKQLILTKDGFKEACHVKVGDRVLTHKNRWKPVINIETEESEYIYEVAARGLPFYATTKTEFYSTISHWDKYRKAGKLYTERHFSPFKWANLNALSKEHFLVTPTIPEENTNLPIDYPIDYFWIMGRFAADGYIHRCKTRKMCKAEKQIRFYITKKEEAAFLEKTSKYITGKEVLPYAYRYKLRIDELYEIFKDFGYSSSTRKLPLWILSLPLPKLEQFWDGYFSGDGFYTTEGKAVAATASFPFAVAMSFVIQRIHGRVPSLRSYKRRGQVSTKDKGTRQFSDSYELSFRVPTKREPLNCVRENYGYARVKKIKRIDQAGMFYHFTIQEDNSYTINGFIVHGK